MTPAEILAAHGPRESMEYDVVVVGAGPAGLATAIRLKQINARAFGRVAGKGQRARRAHHLRRRDGPARADRTVPRLEGTRRAAEPAGDRGRGLLPQRKWQHAHAQLAAARLPAQPRQLRHQPGRGGQVAGRTGRGTGRGDLPRLCRCRSAVHRRWPRARRGHRQCRHRQGWRAARRLSSSAWNCWASTPFSPKARAATWASSSSRASSSMPAATRRPMRWASRNCGRSTPPRPGPAWWCTPPAGRWTSTATAAASSTTWKATASRWAWSPGWTTRTPGSARSKRCSAGRPTR
jgi:hypothetical protein